MSTQGRNRLRELEKTPQMKAPILYHSLCTNCLADTKELHKWFKDMWTGVQWGWVNSRTLVRSTLTPLEVWQACKNPADSIKSDSLSAHLLGSHHWGDQQKDSPQTCISRQLWGTKHEATEAQQLLCSLHSLLQARSKTKEALPHFTETLLRLNWFSDSLPTPRRTSLSLVWQIKKILNKTQCEQIFSYLCYPTGDRLKISKSCNNSCCDYYRIVTMCQLVIYHIKRLPELAWKGISDHRSMCYTGKTNRQPKPQPSLSNPHPIIKRTLCIFDSKLINYLKEILEKATYDLSSLLPKLDV